MRLKTTASLYAIALWFFAMPVLAGDLSSDVRKGASSPNNTDGSYIEVGLGVAVGTSPVYGIPKGNTNGDVVTVGYVDINSRVQYKGFFSEVFSQSLEEFTLGYNFLNSDTWSLDAVALQEHIELNAKDNKDYKGLKTRKGDYMFGPRATAYFGKYIVQLHALTDISGVHEGQVYSAKIAHHWQHKNWNYHAIVGTSYRTQAVMNYYLSVQPEDANEKFPEFHANAGFTSVVEIGATYPISQKWVFRGLIRHSELNKQWSDSPLILTTHPTIVAASVSYVF
jgi:MipA family protein